MKEEAGRSGHCCWVQGDFRGQRKCSKSGCGDAGTTLNKLETINVYPFPFLAMLGPRGCTRASSGCGGQGPALAAVDRGCSGRGGQGLLWRPCRLLSAVASLLGSRGSRVCRLQQLQPAGSSALRYAGSSWTKDGTYVPCIGRRILNHWTTQEAPACVLSLGEL